MIITKGMAVFVYSGRVFDSSCNPKNDYILKYHDVTTICTFKNMVLFASVSIRFHILNSVSVVASITKLGLCI